MWRNDIKCKYMFMFPQKILARKGLMAAIGWNKVWWFRDVYTMGNNNILLTFFLCGWPTKEICRGYSLINPHGSAANIFCTALITKVKIWQNMTEVNLITVHIIFTYMRSIEITHNKQKRCMINDFSIVQLWIHSYPTPPYNMSFMDPTEHVMGCFYNK